jgi:hypothetical protein
LQLEDTFKFMNGRSTYEGKLKLSSIEEIMDVVESHDSLTSMFIYQEPRDIASQLYPVYGRWEIENILKSMMEIRRIFESSFEFTSFEAAPFFDKPGEFLISMYQEARDKVDKMKEQLYPPKSPADASSSEIEEQAKRVAKFHGSVAIRYLEEIMELARTRSYFAPDDRSEVRSIWYCVSSDYILMPIANQYSTLVKNISPLI